MKDMVMIRARVESASPERTQYKPYSATLVFDEPEVYVEIPVPSEHVIEQKGDRVVLSLTGWTIFLDAYSTAVDQMHQKYVQSYQSPKSHTAYR